MTSGDGLLTTLRPFAGRLDPAQALALAHLSETFANRELTLTSRAGIQLRGVSPENWPRLIEAVVGNRLAPPSPDLEHPRILIPPFADPTDPSWALAKALRTTLTDTSNLPAKFTIICDLGPRRELSSLPADLRVEASLQAGDPVVRLGDEPSGRVVKTNEIIPTIIDALEWFRGHRRSEHRRMAALLQGRPAPDQLKGKAQPAAAARPPRLGPHPRGTLMGAPFGVISAATLRELAQTTGVRALRVTPWRSLLVEGPRDLSSPDLLTDDADPLVGVDACPGAPGCAQATVETRVLARRLAQHLRPGGRGPSIHVSGCSKGCARSQAAELVCVGHAGRFDVVRDGRAEDAPSLRGQSPTQLLLGA